jgi:hypothetical protein
MQQATNIAFGLLILLAAAGCGGKGGAAPGEGSLAVAISGARSFNPNIEHGKIAKYVVTIAGEGIASPIVAEFSGDAAEAVIDGVPTGEGRTVVVTAHNPNDATIRAGEAYNVEVDGDLTEVPVAMQAVPIFTNIADGATVDNTRLVFKVFADPAHPAAIEERGESERQVLVDASTSSPQVVLDLATGLGRHAPALIAPGEHRFAIVDLATGRESEAAVLLVDGTGRRPAPIVSAAMAMPRVRACGGCR